MSNNSKSIIVSYISIIFTLVSGLIYTPWLIKELGVSDYAIYSIGTSLMVYFVMDFGFGAAITRFIARYRAENQADKIKSLLGIALKLYLALDLIVLLALVILYFLLNNIFGGLTPEEIEKLKVVYVILAGMTILCIPVMPLNGVFIAYGRVYNVKLFDLLNRIVTIALVCAAILLGYKLYAVVLINAVVTVCINTFKVIFIQKHEQLSFDLKNGNRDTVKELISFSVWISIAMIADKFFFSIEPTLLGAVSNTTQVAIFAVAAQIEGSVLIMADGLNGIFLPQVTNMVIKKAPMEEITKLMTRVGRLQLIIVSFLILFILTQGQAFIDIWFGKNYHLSYGVVMIIFIPCFIHLTQGIGSELVFATQNVRYRAIAFVVGAIVNIILTLILAPSLGAIGAAIGIASGFLVGHECIMNYVYWKKLKVNIFYFFNNCHKPMLLPAILSIAIGYLISFLPIEWLFGFLIKSCCFSISFVAIIYWLYVNESERVQLKSLIKSFLHKEK